MCAEVGEGEEAAGKEALLHVTFLRWAELSQEEFSNPPGSK